MSRLKSAVVAALALLCASAAPAAAARPLQLPTDQPLLFALQADGGTLVRTRRAPASYSLTLRGLPAQGLWFTDRPARDSGDMRLDRFFATWRRLGFDDDAPNAVVSLTSGRRSADAVALTLGRPRFDRRSHTVRFPAKPLRRLSPSLAHLRDDVDRRIPRRFGAVSLFIDDARLYDESFMSTYACDYLGEVDLFPAVAPRSRAYMPADGRRLLIEGNGALYSLLGRESDDRVWFELPTVVAPDGLRYDLCVGGRFPARNGEELEYDRDQGARCTVGSLSLQAQPFRTVGWAPADGRQLKVSDHPELFRAIGGRFGGDGERTFALPRVETAPPGTRWYVCANGYSWYDGEETREACTYGQLALFANRSLPRNYTPADGRQVTSRDDQVVHYLLGGRDDSDVVALPNLPAPAEGTTYGMCSRGILPS